MCAFDVTMKCGTILFAAWSQLFVVVVFSVTVEDEVQTLKAQVNALLQRRQEDYNQLEESLKSSFEKNVEITTLKNEINELRSEIDVLRTEQCSTCTSGNRLKNEQLTVQWLANSIAEIRGEIKELVQSFNTTAELQEQRTLATDISILQNDVVSLRHDVESFKGEIAKSSAKISVLTQDVEVSRQLSQNTAAIAANLTEKLQTAISDWSRTVKNFQKKNDKVFKRMVVVNEEPLDMKVATMTNGHRRYRRHNKALLKQLFDVREDVKALQLSQKRLKHEVADLEEQLSAGLNAFQTRVQTEFEPRLTRLEVLGENLNASVVGINTKISGQEKLHTSMLELLESVESIETKVDSTTPDLKREISKLEFGLAQITSTTSLLKEDQDNQRLSVKALGESLSSIQDKLANHQGLISSLSSKMANFSSIQEEYKNYIKKSTTKENNVELSTESLNIENTFQKLSTIHSQYSNIVNQLPKDCDSVNGVSGPYLVSPDGDTPILVYCEIRTQPTKIAYTVIQRRVNGVQDFNKNWEEYARGFGDPKGEFWLGNEAIHRLTKENQTMARIDFKDISGKAWYAEYSEFSVAPRSDGFRLHVAGYNGNASDALEYQNRMQFSTVDSDRDISNTNCAANYEGGWWFSHCQHTNLNGKYNLGLTWFDLSRNEWIAVSFTEIKLKRKA